MLRWERRGIRFIALISLATVPHTTTPNKPGRQFWGIVSPTRDQEKCLVKHALTLKRLRASSIRNGTNVKSVCGSVRTGSTCALVKHVVSRCAATPHQITTPLTTLEPRAIRSSLPPSLERVGFIVTPTIFSSNTDLRDDYQTPIYLVQYNRGINATPCQNTNRQLAIDNRQSRPHT
jgi:hypothetical protein